MSAQPHAELSSIAATLDDLITRIARVAGEQEAQGSGNLAYELYEIERALTPGQRRLVRLVSRG